MSDITWPDKTTGDSFSAADANEVKTAVNSKQDISYLVYTALLTQSGTDAPVATVLQNTLGGEVVWSRVDAGWYAGTLNGAFTIGKVFGFTGDGGEIGRVFSASGNYNVNSFDVLSSLQVTPTLAQDNLLNNTCIEIRVYP